MNNTVFEYKFYVLADPHTLLNQDQQNVEESLDKPASWFQPQNHKTRLLQFHGSKYGAGLRTDIQVIIIFLIKDIFIIFKETFSCSFVLKKLKLFIRWGIEMVRWYFSNLLSPLFYAVIGQSTLSSFLAFWLL